MDIEGAEYDVFEDIFKNSGNITGIAIEIHFTESGQASKAVKLLSELSKDFILVNVHGNNSTDFVFNSNNAIGKITKLLELTYINKALVTNYHLANKQKHPSTLDMPDWWHTKEVEFEILTDGK
jgi:hypothetical protein